MPPHIIQPLDVGKHAYNASIDSWLMQHPGKPFCVGFAHEKELTPVTLKFKFGIYSFNAKIFTDIYFMPSAVTDQPTPNQVEYINTEINIPTTFVSDDDNTHSKETKNK